MRATDQTPKWAAVFGLESVADLARYAGVAGVAIYGVLFLGYRTYYDRLAVNPEDLGVNNSYILVRSLGFVVLFLIAAALFAALLYIPTKLSRGSRLLGLDYWKLAALALTNGGLVYYFYRLIAGPGTPKFVLPVLFLTLFALSIGSYLVQTHLPRTVWLIAGLITWIIFAALTPAVAIVAQSSARAESARTCQRVDAFTVGAVPVIDVSAVESTALWTSNTAAPSRLFPRAPQDLQLQGTLLGQSPSTVLMCVVLDRVPTLVRLNATTVSLLVR